MNLRLVAKLLGIIALLIGLSMTFSLPWAHGSLGRHTLHNVDAPFEWAGFIALLTSMMICFVVSAGLFYLGKGGKGRLFLREAMAVVGLSWLLATILGALPFLFSGTVRGPSVRILKEERQALVCDSSWQIFGEWTTEKELAEDEIKLVATLLDADWKGLTLLELREKTQVYNADEVFMDLMKRSRAWREVLILPDDVDRTAKLATKGTYRIRMIKMGFADCLFESQSGFSTTGATVISNLEDPYLVPRCILFWRSLTHFLGGLGIIVLFVAILGQGSAGKALMRVEMPGPTTEGSNARMQQTALKFAYVYCGLNAILAILLYVEGMTVFDSLCHAFGTMATGGFSTYNASLGAFVQEGFWSGTAIEYTVILFMILAGTNFTLLFLCVIFQPGKLFWDLEWQVYMGIIFLCTLIIFSAGLYTSTTGFENSADAFRNGLFQIVSIITTTGYGTNDFDKWPQFCRGMMLLLMFVGGCAGSTGGGMKVIRHILFAKILRLEMESAFRPRVIRPLRIGGKPVEDEGLRHSILLYFGMIFAIFAFSWILILAAEPTSLWGSSSSQKVVDTASCVVATLNNIGPGVGTIGATQNYGHLTDFTKIMSVALMMIGRLEIYCVLALFFPKFWRD